MSEAEGDPGWGTSVRGLVWVLVPGIAVRRMARGGQPLQMLRMLFVAFAAGLVLVGVVVAVLDANDALTATVSTSVALAVVAVVGIGGLVASTVVVPSLDCTSSETLSESYKRRFFLRIALAEAATLTGFVGFILSADPVVYVVGLAITAVGFARLAPTRGHLEADQRVLARNGCAVTLTGTLTTSPHESQERRP